MDLMTLYPLLKFAHILSAAVLFGTGLGTAFHMWMAHRSGNVSAIAVAARNTVKADFWFTAPAVVIQLLTGIAMIVFVGFKWNAEWLIYTYILFAIAGFAWIPVVKIQIEVAKMAEKAAAAGKPLPKAYFKKMKIWYRLGWPAFIAVIIIFYLMVFKPEIWSY